MSECGVCGLTCTAGVTCAECNNYVHKGSRCSSNDASTNNITLCGRCKLRRERAHDSPEPLVMDVTRVVESAVKETLQLETHRPEDNMPTSTVELNVESDDKKRPAQILVERQTHEKQKAQRFEKRRRLGAKGGIKDVLITPTPGLRVLDACNMRHNTKLPTKSRKACLMRIDHLLQENKAKCGGVVDAVVSDAPAGDVATEVVVDQTQTDEECVTPTEKIPAVRVEYKCFKETKSPGLYTNTIIALYKKLEISTRKGKLFNVEGYLDGHVAEPDIKPTPSPSQHASSSMDVGSTKSFYCPMPRGMKQQKGKSTAPSPININTTSATTNTLDSDDTIAAADDDDGTLKFVEFPFGRACLVDTLAQLDQVLDLFDPNSDANFQTNANVDVVSLDLEGVNFGKDGTISTLQMCKVNSKDVFIIDIAKLKHKAFAIETRSLRDILESEKITKLMWDCRSDASALFFEYRVKLAGVCDLQLLSVAVLCTAGKKMSHLPGLGSILNASQYTPLEGAEKSRLSQVKLLAHQLFAPDLGGSYHVWLDRPLKPILFEYATDCMYFHPLRVSLNRFRNGRFISSEELFGEELAEGVKTRLTQAINGEIDNNDRDSAVKVNQVFRDKLSQVLKDEEGRRIALVEAKKNKTADSDDEQWESTKKKKQPKAAFKVQVAEIVTKLLKPHFKTKRIKSIESFKEIAKSITEKLLIMSQSLNKRIRLSAIEREASVLVRVTLCDLDPMS
eukprot:m.155788 g.155788  ORF g.155788 m.155788 type:complete len:734 (-) comp30955_c0_seq2:226-2427(-)